MSVLLIGYGKIGKKIYKDYEKIITDIYDPNVKEYNVLIKKKYKLVIVCVPDENIMHIISDANIETDYYLIKSTINPNDIKDISSFKNVVYSPEYKSGQSLNGLENEIFTILSGDTDTCRDVQNIIQSCFNAYHSFYYTDIKTACAVKYTSNATLAMLVTWWNELYSMCENNNIDYNEFRNLLTLDPRIPKTHSLHFGETYNSHCLNKDTVYLKTISKSCNILDLIINIHNKKGEE